MPPQYRETCSVTPNVQGALAVNLDGPHETSPTADAASVSDSHVSEPETDTGLVFEPDEKSDEASDELAAILIAAAAGDAAAWRRLVERYSRRLFALARSRCKDIDVAEEITQSVFATLAAKISTGGYHEQGRFEPWLFRVAMNRIRDHVRRSSRQLRIRGDVAVPEASDRVPTEATENQAALGRLSDAIQRLSDADREIVTLRHHGGMSFKQISDLLDEPLGTLLARHHRALKKLRELMEVPIRDESKGVVL